MSADSPLARRAAQAMFAAFAFAYFFSALVRAITATLAPTLTTEFALASRDLGLLAGGYFLGFAAMQLPLGKWLDRFGPRRVNMAFLAVAVVGCVLFSFATSFAGLFAARILCGVGLSAGLMAPLTGFRRWLGPQAQLRGNSWMLMTGSLGMLASTLPVQWLMPLTGWRGLFLIAAVGIAIAIGLTAWLVPKEPAVSAASAPAARDADASDAGYAPIWRNPTFRRMAPLGFFNYGGLVAVQTLWAGPWMVRVAGYTPAQAAAGLFAINASMLVAFWFWGLVNPKLVARGLGPATLIAWGTPASLVVLAAIVWAGPAAGAAAWAAFCVASTFVSLSQPAVGLAFPSALAGRALSGFNLAIFGGVFTVQWGLGLLIDAFRAQGLGEVDAFRASVGVFLVCCVGGYLWFLRGERTVDVRGTAELARSAGR